MGTLVLRTKNFAPRRVATWKGFQRFSKSLRQDSVASGIMHFFSKGKCTAEDVFNFLGHHPDGPKIWNDLHFEGGTVQGCFIICLRKSFLTQHENDPETISLYSTYLSDPKPQVEYVN